MYSVYFKELGIIKNTVRDPGGTGNIVKFGPDRVQEFLKNNNLQLIIRAHECVMDGFERFAGGQLITVFSATDYCGFIFYLIIKIENIRMLELFLSSKQIWKSFLN